jgi:uncharacterized membrane protein SpoIIM required for sporulation
VSTRALSARWLDKRKAHWSRLEALVTAGARGVAELTHDEIQELALLYRQTAADLSTARDDPGSVRLAEYLNQLLGRAHNLIYAGRPSQPIGILHFLASTFPLAFRTTLPYTAAAVALFALGAATSAIMAAADPGFERFLLGGRMMDTIERREMWTHGIVAIKPFASSAIMTNNLSVAVTAFATGILAGLGTIYMMFFNGLLIGVVGIACHRAGMSLSLWSFVAPHGVLELPAIFIAGGAGLILAKGVLIPGTLPRRDAIAEAGHLAIRLFLGVVPMLVVAGLIEGFVSPTSADPWIKLLIGAALLVLLTFYLLRAGRDPSESISRSEAVPPMK